MQMGISNGKRFASAFLAMIMTVTMCIGGLTIPVYADDSGSGGWGGSNDGGGNAAGEGTWGDEKVGYRITLITPEGEHVISKDVLWTSPGGYSSSVLPCYTTKVKNGASDSNVVLVTDSLGDGGSLASRNIPKPIIAAAGTANGFTGNGSEFEAWILTGSNSNVSGGAGGGTGTGGEAQASQGDLDKYAQYTATFNNAIQTQYNTYINISYTSSFESVINSLKTTYINFKSKFESPTVGDQYATAITNAAKAIVQSYESHFGYASYIHLNDDRIPLADPDLSAGDENGNIGFLINGLFEGKIALPDGITAEEADFDGNGTVRAAEIAKAADYHLLAEPIVFYRPIDSYGSTYPYIIYGTISNIAEWNLAQGWDRGGNMGNLSNLVGPSSLTNNIDWSLGSISIASASPSSTMKNNTEIISNPPNFNGLALQVYRPSGMAATAMTHTWDYPLGDTPGPAPLPPLPPVGDPPAGGGTPDPSDPGGSPGSPTDPDPYHYNIVKFYVSIVDDGMGGEQEIPDGNFIREKNPPTIKVEDELSYKLTDWHTSPTYTKPEAWDFYEDVRGTMEVKRDGTTPQTITLANPETTVYLKLVKRETTAITNNMNGAIIIEQSQVTKAISTADSSIAGWGVAPAMFVAGDNSGSHTYTHSSGYHGYDSDGDPHSCPGHTCTYVVNNTDYKYVHSNSAPIVPTIQAENAGGGFAAVLTGEESGNWPISGGSLTSFKFIYESVVWRGLDVPTIAKYKHDTHVLTGLTNAISNISQHKRKVATSDTSYADSVSIVFDWGSGKDNYTDSKHATGCTSSGTAKSSDHTASWPTYNATVTVKMYTGNPANKSVGQDTYSATIEKRMSINGFYSDHASGKMKQYTGQMKFFPYLRMTYQVTQQYDPSRTEVSVLSEYLSGILPNAYAEAGWHQVNDGKDALRMTSQQWSVHARATAGTEVWQQKNAVLPGGAIYTLDTENAELSVKVATWQPVITDPKLSQAMTDAGTDVTEYSVATAETEHTAYAQKAADVLEHLRVVQWANTTVGASKAWESGGVKLLTPGTTKFDNRTTSSDSKYYLKDDTTGDGKQSDAVQGDLDVDVSGSEKLYYRVYSDPWGNILLAQSSSESGVSTATGSVVAKRTDAPASINGLLTGIAKELDDKTYLITNYAKAIERNAGTDMSDQSIVTNAQGKWYNEQFSIMLIYQSTTFSVGLKNPNLRSAALDPVLCPPNTGGQSSMLTKAYLSQFRVNDKAYGYESKDSEYIGTFRGIDITLKDMQDMLQSKKFYIPNATVQDLN